MDWKTYGTNSKQDRLTSEVSNSIFHENLPYDLRVWVHQHTNIQLVYMQQSRDIYNIDRVERTCTLFMKVDPRFEPFCKCSIKSKVLNTYKRDKYFCATNLRFYININETS